MPFQLLLDEDSQARDLVRLLREAGHDVLTVNEAELRGHSDEDVWKRAQQEGRALLTRNPDDFEAILTHAPADHPGVVAVYQSNDPGKNMSYVDIVRAIDNLEAGGISPAGYLLPLNHFRW